MNKLNVHFTEQVATAIVHRVKYWYGCYKELQEMILEADIDGDGQVLIIPFQIFLWLLTNISKISYIQVNFNEFYSMMITDWNTEKIYNYI